MGPLIRPFLDHHPKISEQAWLAENAVVIGQVTIEARANIWYNCVLRGDVNSIFVGEGSNIQDGSVVHVNGDPSHPTVIEKQVTVGHMAAIHGCTLKQNSLVGIQATVLNGAVVEEEALVAAGSVVREGQIVPARTLVAGVPAKPIRTLLEDEIKFLQHQPVHYWEDIASKY
jgi:carbonic anhydrase/acetyltransferase-like protein (isoleucine patch superfamily)